MKKILILLLAFLIFVPSIFNFYPIEAEAKTIADLREELEEIEEQEANNNNDIEQTESEISQTKSEIATIYSNIDSITLEIHQSNTDIENLNNDIAEKDEATKALLASLQKTTGNSFYVEYLFGADTIEDFIYRYAMTEEITSYNSNLITEMNDKITELNIRKEELATQQEELETKQEELAIQLQSLSNTKVQLYELSRSIEDEIANAKSVIEMYKAAGCGEDEDLNVCAAKLLPSDTKFWRPFAPGYVTSEYGYRNAIYSGGTLISSSGFHEGIDISNSRIPK